MAGRIGGPRTGDEQPSLPQTEQDIPEVDLPDEQEEAQQLSIQPSMTADQYLASACRIDPAALLDGGALQQEYLRVTDDLHYYMPQMLDAIEASALAKLNAEEVAATARLAIRRKYKEEKISEATLDAEVTISPSVHAARVGEITARKEEIRMKHVVRIIEHKASMLIQLGADMREDKKQGLSIKEKNPS